ncbi:hypothetical protein EDB85DRAFT_1890866 [Lactarius pseudohatsudake]|nr:hypothetical protein EDB85DRAFT_1890866 [Lactarius pseudohatsudake]
MAHYDTFRDQLAIAHPAFGYALWEPDPGEHNSPVEVGDVGYIRQGRFHRIFNALLPANHSSHEDLGVPEGHEPLRPRMQDHINRGTLSPNTFYSYGVTVVSGGLEVIAAETANSVQDSFSFTRKYGAVLSLPVTSRREDTLVLGHFRKWIITHVDSWFAFAQKHRLGIEMEDIILVTGCHRATSWTHVAFNEVHADAQRTSGPQITGNLGDPANWPVSGQHSQGTVLRRGPSGENLPENQCVFVRGYRVARTSEILSRVRRVVGPTADPSGSDSGLNTAVVPIPRVTEYRDPLHILLEYIAKQAPPNCDMVLVHDDDLTRLSGIIDGSSLEALNPDAVMRLLQRSEPPIKVISGEHPPAPYSWIS